MARQHQNVVTNMKVWLKFIKLAIQRDRLGVSFCLSFALWTNNSVIKVQHILFGQLKFFKLFNIIIHDSIFNFVFINFFLYYLASNKGWWFNWLSVFFVNFSLVLYFGGAFTWPGINYVIKCFFYFCFEIFIVFLLVLFLPFFI